MTSVTGPAFTFLKSVLSFLIRMILLILIVVVWIKRHEPETEFSYCRNVGGHFFWTPVNHDNFMTLHINEERVRACAYACVCVCVSYLRTNASNAWKQQSLSSSSSTSMNLTTIGTRFSRCSPEHHTHIYGTNIYDSKKPSKVSIGQRNIYTLLQKNLEIRSKGSQNE